MSDMDWRMEKDSAPLETAGDFYAVGKRLTRYFGPGGDIMFPEGFTEIGSGVFQDCEGAVNITGITIPKSITRIKPYVFTYCTNLREIRVEAGNQHYCVIDGLLMERNGSVLHSCPPTRSGVLTVPKGVTEIGEYAFAVCMRLTHVTIPESVTRIGPNAFKFCRELTGVTIPEGVTVIGHSAFWNCSSLTDVTIPKSVTDIGDFAFNRCTNLTRVVIPEGVARIGVSPFYGCTNLSEIQAEAGNQHYCVIDGLLMERDGSALCLHTCPTAKSGVLEIPEGVTRIAEFAFGGCTGLTGVVIPGSVWEISESAFDGCSGLTHVTMLEGVRYIGESAFAGCANLTHVTFPKNILEIDDSAFYDTGVPKKALQAAYDQARENEFLEMEANGAFLLPEEVWGIGEE